MFALLKKESKIIIDGLISPLSIAFYLNGPLLVFNFVVNDLTVFWHSSMKAISVRGKGGIGGGGIRNSGGPSGVSRKDDIPDDDAEHRDHQND